MSTHGNKKAALADALALGAERQVAAGRMELAEAEERGSAVSGLLEVCRGLFSRAGGTIRGDIENHKPRIEPAAPNGQPVVVTDLPDWEGQLEEF